MPDEQYYVLWQCPKCAGIVDPAQAVEHMRFAHPLPRAKEDRRRIRFADKTETLPGFASPTPLPKGR